MIACGRERIAAGLAAAVLSFVPGARAAVYLNELTIRPVGVSETVELYNSGPGVVDVTGWKIRGNKGSYVIPPPGLIADGGRLVLSVGDIQDERGGVTSLIDLVPGSGLLPTGRDSVHYGTRGSAPLPPTGTSLARAPDAALGTPPPPHPDHDGLVWTIDFSPTFGNVNDAPVPQMGAPVLLNELDPTPPGQDRLELYNPTGADVSVTNWKLVNGASWQTLSGSVPAGGFLVVTTGFDLDEVGLAYLFRQDQTRVDQLGFHDAPPLGDGYSYGRCPDGAPPYLGYDFVTSGGWSSFFVLPATFGGPNGPCVPGGIEEVPKTWGRVKHRFQDRR